MQSTLRSYVPHSRLASTHSTVITPGLHHSWGPVCFSCFHKALTVLYQSLQANNSAWVHTGKKLFYLGAGVPCQSHHNCGAHRNLGLAQMPANRETKKDANNPYDSHRGQCHGGQWAAHRGPVKCSCSWSSKSQREKLVSGSQDLHSALSNAEKQMQLQENYINTTFRAVTSSGGAKQDRKQGLPHRADAVQTSSWCPRIYITLCIL